MPAICPYLDGLGAETKVVSVRRCREVRGGEDSGHQTAVELTLSALPEAGLADTLAKLERFLKKFAEDSGSAARFRIWVLEGEHADA